MTLGMIFKVGTASVSGKTSKIGELDGRGVDLIRSLWLNFGMDFKKLNNYFSLGDRNTRLANIMKFTG